MSRFSLLSALGLGTVLLAGAGGRADEAGKLRVYVGTYTAPGKSQGIYVLELDRRSGALSKPRLAGEAVNPSFLAIHPSGRFLYAVDEVGEFAGQKSGALAAFAVAPKTGKLTLLNHQPSRGQGPCHIITDKPGKHVLAANYGSGSAVVAPIGPDGKLGPPTGFVQHRGKSVNPQRQEGPHAHSINLDKANRFAVVADLGLDLVAVYPFDSATGKLGAQQTPATYVKRGSGPRHFAFHPDGKHAYVINEMVCTVTAFDYDADKGALSEIQTISTLPGKFQEGYSTAEVQVHPSGKFLYGSNRGHDSIAVFAIDAPSGMLKRLQNQPTGGKTPRNFGIDPSGTFLLAANQDSDSIVVFRIDAKTGRLRETGHRVEVPMPVCVKMMPAP